MNEQGRNGDGVAREKNKGRELSAGDLRRFLRKRPEDTEYTVISKPGGTYTVFVENEPAGTVR